MTQNIKELSTIELEQIAGGAYAHQYAKRRDIFSITVLPPIKISV
jgi:hypothetical protein